jgi:SOS-response transcriptional repressor LexA
MQISDKIRAILKLPGMTQLKLASELSTTQPTVNRWLKGTSPEGANRDRINALYADWVAKDREDARAVTALPVVGTIQAGWFRDISVASQDEHYDRIPVARSDRFPDAPQYALVVSGDSMDLLFPDGCFVTCVDFHASGLDLKNGMVVHVERTRDGNLVETTLKQIDTVNGQMALVPRSKNPIYKTIIDFHSDENEVHVRGLVTGKWEPQAI